MPLPSSSTAVMGILNVTHDSFFEGSRSATTEDAVARALAMYEEGAAIIDIGGESTGPGSRGVPSAMELRRVMPVVRGILRKRPDAVLSIDTWKSAVAREALTAGVTLVNDVTAGRGDPRMLALVADDGCRYVLMRSKDSSPRTTVANVQYEDVIRTIRSFFEERLAAAERAGIRRENIILDPGLGHFVSSDPRYSWEILERLEELLDFGCRILVAPSRKSFTAEHPDQPPAERLPGTLRATEIALAHGANIIRTHDVGETRRIVEKVGTMPNSTPPYSQSHNSR